MRSYKIDLLHSNTTALFVRPYCWETYVHSETFPWFITTYGCNYEM